MGDREKASLRLQFNPQIRLELHGATITSDAGLLAFRELDDALDPYPHSLRLSPGKPYRPQHPTPPGPSAPASPSTAAWPATMIPTMQNVFPKTQP